MPTIFKNSHEYKVIALSPEEMQRWPRAAVCDRCECHPTPAGFYVAAYNLFYCTECYTDWCAGAREKLAGVEEQETNYLTHAIAQLNASTYFFGRFNNSTADETH